MDQLQRSSKTPDPWILPLPGFKPTNFNYTAPHPDSCLTCHNYDEIDTFAQAVTLQKLYRLYGTRVESETVTATNSVPESTSDSEPKSTSDSDKPEVFNATILLNSIVDFLEPDRKAPWSDRIKEKWFKSKFQDNLQTIFSLYASFPIKNEFDLGEQSEILAEKINKITKERMEAGEAKDSERLSELEVEQTTLVEEMTDNREMYVFLQEVVRPRLVEGVARALWFAFVKAKNRSANFDMGPEAQIDYVARARFFHTWIRLSVTYNHGLWEKIKGTDYTPNRLTSDILSTGTEVCQGYADMFSQMFNACESKDESKAVSLHGYTRPNGGTQNYEITSKQAKETSHTWAALHFPVPIT